MVITKIFKLNYDIDRDNIILRDFITYMNQMNSEYYQLYGKWTNVFLINSEIYNIIVNNPGFELVDTQKIESHLNDINNGYWFIGNLLE